VVLEDQSPGKSSVLHSLTGFGFPQDAGLCTQYATQISCRRGPVERVVLSIIPGRDANEATAARLGECCEQVPAPLTNDHLTTVFKEIHGIMNIRINANNKTPGRRAFSEHMLKIEMEVQRRQILIPWPQATDPGDLERRRRDKASF
jgi:hypothetical protein